MTIPSMLIGYLPISLFFLPDTPHSTHPISLMIRPSDKYPDEKRNRFKTSKSEVSHFKSRQPKYLGAHAAATESTLDTHLLMPTRPINSLWLDISRLVTGARPCPIHLNSGHDTFTRLFSFVSVWLYFCHSHSRIHAPFPLTLYTYTSYT